MIYSKDGSIPVKSGFGALTGQTKFKVPAMAHARPARALPPRKVRSLRRLSNSP